MRFVRRNVLTIHYCTSVGQCGAARRGRTSARHRCGSRATTSAEGVPHLPPQLRSAAFSIGGQSAGRAVGELPGLRAREEKTGQGGAGDGGRPGPGAAAAGQVPCFRRCQLCTSCRSCIDRSDPMPWAASPLQ